MNYNSSGKCYQKKKEKKATKKVVKEKKARISFQNWLSVQGYEIFQASIRRNFLEKYIFLFFFNKLVVCARIRNFSSKYKEKFSRKIQIFIFF